MAYTTASIAEQLSRAVSCRVIGPSDADFDAMRAGFNAMIDRRPAAIVCAGSDADIATAVRLAREHALPLAIRAGGHSAPGFGCCDDGIVIDVREFDAIAVDPSARTIRCGTGLTWKQFDAATQEHGLAVTGGRVSSTGVTGLTIGSGSGWLERAMGLTSDSLVGARMVTADGLSVDTDSDADLLWALRGGGGNFGVLTELRLALSPIGPTVWGGVRMYSAEQTAAVFRAYRDVMATADPLLCGGLVLMTAPHEAFVPRALRGTPVVTVVVLWAGSAADGEQGVAVLDGLGVPAVDRVGPVPYAWLQSSMDAWSPPGNRDYFKGGFVRSLGDDAVDAIAALGSDLRSPLTQILCTPLGADTAYGRVGDEHSTIGNRDQAWSFQVLSLWADAAQDAEQTAWTRAAADNLSAHSPLVSYPNFLAADQAGDVHAAYSPQTLARLRSVKNRYDPSNVFRLNNNITPSAPSATT